MSNDRIGVEKDVKLAFRVSGVRKVTREIKGLGSSANDTSNATQRLTKNLNLLNMGIAGLTFGAAIMQMKRMADQFAILEKSMAEISTLTVENVDKLGHLNKALMETQKIYGSTTQLQAKALYDIISAGADHATEAVELLNTANLLAVGGITTVANAADGLTSIMNSYKSTALKAEEASDALFTAMRFGKTTISELSFYIGAVAPVSAAAGVSFEEVAAAIAAVTKQGLSTSRAINGIRQMLLMIIKPTKEAQKVAEGLGVEFDAASLRTKGLVGFLEHLREKTGGASEKMAGLMGGIEALLPATALTGAGFEDVIMILDEMSKSAGISQRSFEKMTDTFLFQFDRAIATIRVQGIELTKPLVEASKSLLMLFNENFDKIIDILENAIKSLGAFLLVKVAMIVPAWALSIKGLKAAFIGLTGAVKAYTVAQISANSALTVFRGILRTLGIGLLIMVLVEVFEKLNTEFDLVGKTGDVVVGAFKLIGNVVTSLIDAFTWLSEKISLVLDGLIALVKLDFTQFARSFHHVFGRNYGPDVSRERYRAALRYNTEYSGKEWGYITKDGDTEFGGTNSDGLTLMQQIEAQQQYLREQEKILKELNEAEKQKAEELRQQLILYGARLEKTDNEPMTKTQQMWSDIIESSLQRKKREAEELHQQLTLYGARLEKTDNEVMTKTQQMWSDIIESSLQRKKREAEELHQQLTLYGARLEKTDNEPMTKTQQMWSDIIESSLQRKKREAEELHQQLTLYGARLEKTDNEVMTQTQQMWSDIIESSLQRKKREAEELHQQLTLYGARLEKTDNEVMTKTQQMWSDIIESSLQRKKREADALHQQLTLYGARLEKTDNEVMTKTQQMWSDIIESSLQRKKREADALHQQLTLYGARLEKTDNEPMTKTQQMWSDIIESSLQRKKREAEELHQQLTLYGARLEKTDNEVMTKTQQMWSDIIESSLQRKKREADALHQQLTLYGARLEKTDNEVMTKTQQMWSDIIESSLQRKKREAEELHQQLTLYGARLEKTDNEVMTKTQQMWSDIIESSLQRKKREADALHQQLTLYGARLEKTDNEVMTKTQQMWSDIIESSLQRKKREAEELHQQLTLYGARLEKTDNEPMTKTQQMWSDIIESSLQRKKREAEELHQQLTLYGARLEKTDNEVMTKTQQMWSDIIESSLQRKKREAEELHQQLTLYGARLEKTDNEAMTQTQQMWSRIIKERQREADILRRQRIIEATRLEKTDNEPMTKTQQMWSDIMNRNRELNRIEYEKQQRIRQNDPTQLMQTVPELVSNQLDELQKNAITTAQIIANALVRSMDTATESIMNFVKTGKFEFNNFANSIIDDILRMAIKQQLVMPLYGAMFGTGGMFNGGFGGGASGSTSPTNFSVGVNHTGGIIGQAGITRNVSPLAFLDAPRLHTGGLIGLRPNERPIIGELGEEVLTKNDPRHIKNGGGKVSVIIKNTIVNEGGNVQTEVTEGKSNFENGKYIIEQIVTNKVRQSLVDGELDGPLSAAMARV